MGEHPLDNQVWHMLSNDFAEYTIGTDHAKRCDPEVLPFSAFADHHDDSFRDLKAYCDKGEITVLFSVDAPTKVPGFRTQDQIQGHQFVCQQRTPIPDHDVEMIDLTMDDVDEMSQLVDLTHPGPFFPRLVEFGDYVGIRQEGKLVAMAGIRIRLPGYAEITAVCTHPDWRGRGYANLLTCVVADRIWERGDTPYLHAVEGNTAAIRIYEKLHFVERSQVMVVVLKRR